MIHRRPVVPVVIKPQFSGCKKPAQMNKGQYITSVPGKPQYICHGK